MSTTARHETRPGLEVRSEGGVVFLPLDRPERRNALSRGLLGELARALGTISADPAARVVVLSGRGPACCSGHDLGERTGRSEAEYRDLFEACARVMLALRG